MRQNASHSKRCSRNSVVTVDGSALDVPSKDFTFSSFDDGVPSAKGEGAVYEVSGFIPSSWNARASLAGKMRLCETLCPSSLVATHSTSPASSSSSSTTAVVSETFELHTRCKRLWYLI